MWRSNRPPLPLAAPYHTRQPLAAPHPRVNLLLSRRFHGIPAPSSRIPVLTAALDALLARICAESVCSVPPALPHRWLTAAPRPEMSPAPDDDTL